MKFFLQTLFRPAPIGLEAEFDVFLGGCRRGANVLIFSEQINATYFIFFDIPLRRLHAKGKANVAVVSQARVASGEKNCWEHWNQIFCPDVVVMSRYGLPWGGEIVDYFRKRNVPVVYHIDDDLLDIPESLGPEIKARQGAQAVVDERVRMLKTCDIIHASTGHLASVLKSRFPNQRIWHGLYTPYLGEQVQAKVHSSGRQVLGYMGSKGHRHDLELVVPAVERLMDERPGLEFEVFGSIAMPERLQRFKGRVRRHPVAASYLEFLRKLAELEWKFGLAPLTDEPFNLCKTPTKFIEYTAAGVPVIASNVPVYADAIPPQGGLLANTDGWYCAIRRYLDSPDERLNALRISQEHCERVFNPLVQEQQLHRFLRQVMT